MLIFNQLCQRIRDLTLDSADLVQDANIEQCHHLLVTRQTLLDELKIKYITSPENNQMYTPVFVELLQWIQVQDAVNYTKVIKLRNENTQATVKQVKVNKAIHQYKNVT
ncbi:MAG: hypothetical protein RPR97_10205 [Colwellia sp.]